MILNGEKFIWMYSNEYGSLKQEQISGLKLLLTCFAPDPNIYSFESAAYMLATVKHECAGTWQPIPEYGKGKGRKYGTPDSVTGQTYYGRGYVQLTWKGNYETQAKRLGIDLLNNPDLALRPVYAYDIMSYGMTHGSFTGKKLKDYINEKGVDYKNARRIINGTDKAELIAGYAVALERMLRNATEVTQ